MLLGNMENCDALNLQEKASYESAQYCNPIYVSAAHLNLGLNIDRQFI